MALRTLTDTYLSIRGNENFVDVSLDFDEEEQKWMKYYTQVTQIFEQIKRKSIHFSHQFTIKFRICHNYKMNVQHFDLIKMKSFY